MTVDARLVFPKLPLGRSLAKARSTHTVFAHGSRFAIYSTVETTEYKAEIKGRVEKIMVADVEIDFAIQSFPLDVQRDPFGLARSELF